MLVCNLTATFLQQITNDTGELCPKGGILASKGYAKWRRFYLNIAAVTGGLAAVIAVLFVSSSGA